MRINAISNYQHYALQNTRSVSNVRRVDTPSDPNEMRILHISFQGNPSKHPGQISAYATESNFLGGIYKAGGLGDVGEALPDAIAVHGKDFVGKDVDMRTFVPYYSMDDSEGRIYVLTKDGSEKRKNGETLNLIKDFKQVNQDYKLQDGEQFSLVVDIDGSKNVKQHWMLKDTQLAGAVERMQEKGLEMESVPYRVFEIDTEGKRKDRWYTIHTYEHAKGKSAYGVFRNHAITDTTGTTAYGGSGSTAYGGSSSAGEKTMHYRHSKTDDMFYTEQLRAYQQLTMEGKMDSAIHGNFNPQNHLFHDRFCYSALSDVVQKANSGDKNYQGLRFVELLHNPGASYQGKYANPLDFFRIVATKEDLAKLQANEHYSKVNEIASKIEKGTATEKESTQLYNFFKPYFKKLMDSEGLFNMTMLAVRMTDENPENSNVGNVSKNYGKETRNPDTVDIAKGLTEELRKIEDKTIDVVNGSKKANMASDKMGAFFGTGSLHEMFKTKYSPFSAADSPDKIFKAKLENKKNLINEIAEATKKIATDKDAIAKVFFSEAKMNAIREQAKAAEANLPLTIGGLSEFKEGDILFTTWGRPDKQKGFPITLESFKMMLKDESIPLEVRKRCKLVMGAGGGNDAFAGNNSEWIEIKKIMKEIGEISADGEKGAFKSNVLYVNGLFPGRIANCADLGIFTSEFEPCGITPFECFATGTPVASTRTGGAPDFVKPGVNGFLTDDPFMLNPEKLGLKANATEKEIYEARKNNIAKQMANKLKEFITPLLDNTWEAKQKEYIKNGLAEKIEWHNNNSYNNGRAALDIYLNDKLNVKDNNLPDTYKSDMRGEFDNDAFKVITETGGGDNPPKGRISKGGKIALIAGGVAVVAAVLGAIGHKAGWFKSKPVDEKQADEPEINDDVEFDDFSEADEISEIE